MYRLGVDDSEVDVAVLPLYGDASDARRLAGIAGVARGQIREEAAEGRIDLRWPLFFAALVLLGWNYFATARRSGGKG